MMKKLAIVVALFAFIVGGITLYAPDVSAEDVEVINLSAGDQVNQDKFTVVAKGSGFQAGDSITIQVRLTNNTTGQMSTEQLSVTAK